MEILGSMPFSKGGINMPRKKKTEDVKEEKIIKEQKPVDYGTGWVRVNNMLQAGFTIEQIRGESK